MSKRLGTSAFTPLMFDPRPALSSGASPEALALPASAETGRVIVSRRKVLVGMTALSAMALWGYPLRALAAPPVGLPLWSLSKDAFVSLLTWFINEAIGPRLRSPYRLREGDVTPQATPTPGGRQFHNSYASVFTVNANMSLPTMETQFGFYMELVGYLRAYDLKDIPAITDMNGPELRRSQHIYAQTDGRHLIFPASQRHPPFAEELVAFDNYCKEKGLTRSDYSLEYCRIFKDGENRFRGFAIESTRLGSAGADVLLADDE